MRSYRSYCTGLYGTLLILVCVLTGETAMSVGKGLITEGVYSLITNALAAHALDAGVQRWGARALAVLLPYGTTIVVVQWR